MMKVTCYTLTLLACVAVSGCGPQGGGAADNGNKGTADALTATELAAYAASHAYPTTQPMDSLRVAAIISTDRSTLRLYNFSNKPLPEVDVWVNGAWLQHVRGLPANGSVDVKTLNLYNAFGKNFASQSEPVSKVQISIGSSFYNAMGPVTQ